MVMQRNGQIDPSVSATADVERASAMIFRIEKKMSERLGWTVRDVRPKVARALRTSIGTVANLRRQRRKTVPGFLSAAIRHLLINELQMEMQSLQHELDVARQTGLDHREDAFAQAEAALDAARALLSEAASAG